ncbi:purine-nucleoside phosphorylase [Canibacter zhoujuaniae]|uniref:phosphorylase family protein n=1 Tax=Canibacter zhoujuaniae TaxID=2708343 RepID=UPI00141FAB7B|nr:purine-nucleoside phosphorylase [Canibacter zhoujuaniae]
MASALSTLLVFAHQDEASAFTDLPHLVTGVGKVNAAVELAFALHQAAVSGNPYQRVIVLGTAGIVGREHDLDTVVQITRAVQHDFPLPSPEVAITNSPKWEATAAIATGDEFVSTDEKRREIVSLGASLCDMEIYAYARITDRFGVPLEVYKVPSDFADEAAVAEWDEVVFLKSQQLRKFYDEKLSAAASEK